MFTPLVLSSNEYFYVQMRGGGWKRPYLAAMKDYDPHVTTAFQKGVQRCTNSSMQPYSCIKAAMNRIEDIENENPWGLSYSTGAVQGEVTEATYDGY